MGVLGKSINIYLMDGTTSGRWVARLSNWNGVAYKIPRKQINDCNDIKELNQPGVYFLYGPDETKENFVYIGETDNVLQRIKQHRSFEDAKTYWTEVVIFVTSDGMLEKGRVKYLENRFYAMACEAKRSTVKNGNTPKQSPMPQQIKDALEEFIINVKLILPTLGYKTFVEVDSKNDNQDNEKDYLYCSRNKGETGKGIGKLESDGFWLLKGSYINPKIATYISPGIKKAREEYKKTINKNNILTENIRFSSPSAASTFVFGKSSNGLDDWKNKDGLSLNDLETGNGKAKTNTHCEILHMSGQKVSARAVLTDNGIKILKGSEMFTNEGPSCRESVKTMRRDLIKNKQVVKNIFQEDVEFNSPSTAASCILGTSANGWDKWLYENGESLNDRKK